MEEKEFPFFSSKSFRLRFCLLMAFGMWSIASMRLDLSIAIPCMVISDLSDSFEMNRTQNSTVSQGSCRAAERQSSQINTITGTIAWSPSMQSLLFSATFYGSFVTNFFAGYCVDRYGPKMPLIAISSALFIISYLSPPLASHSFWGFFALRFAVGLADSFLIPCMNGLAVKWFASDEKSTVAAIYSSGGQLAAGVSSLIGSYLCLSIFGWPSIFYFFGLIGTIWCGLCAIFFTNSPHDNRFLSSKERKFLETNAETIPDLTKQRVPWAKIFYSKEILACSFNCFAGQLVSTLMQSFLPTFLKENLGLPMSQIGIYTALPFMAQLFAKNTLSPLSDYLKRSRGIDPTRMVKIFQSISCFGSAVSVVLLLAMPTCEEPFWAIFFLILYGVTFACQIPGYFTSVLTLAPAYTGIITSIAAIFGTLGSLAGPLTLSLISHLGLDQKWAFAFGMSALMQIMAGISFLVWGKAKILRWAEEVNDEMTSSDQ